MTANNPLREAISSEKLRCINEFDGKFLVLAGPGTGKTFTVSRRIKNMIEKGIDPARILCLTFSDTGAKEMKKGIEKALNIRNSDIMISTYHGFSLDIIKNNPERFLFGGNPNIINESMKTAFMKECIDEYTQGNPQKSAFKTDKNSAYYYIGDILEKIDEIKKYGLDKKQYLNNIATNKDYMPLVMEKYENWQKSLRKNPDKPKTAALIDAETKVAQAQEVWELYELYEAKKQRKKFLDFNDMILSVLDEFDNNESFRKEVAAGYDYIIVDEYQDTNPIQNELLFKLVKTKEKQNIFAVGDDDQIIYTFQGAKLETIKNFIREFDLPDNNIICFKENRRSTAKILELARQIAVQNDLMLEKDPEFKKYGICKELKSVNEKLFDKNKDVRCLIYEDAFRERVHIINEIEELINSDECPVDKETGEKKLSEIAILAAKHDDLQEYARLLYSRNIPYNYEKGKSIFEIQGSAILFRYMRFLYCADRDKNNFFEMILSKPFNINPRDYNFLCKSQSNYKSFTDNMRDYKKKDYKILIKKKKKESDAPDEFEEIFFSAPEKIDKFLKTYDELSELKDSTDLRETILAVGNKTGIFDYYFNCKVNRSENIAGIKKLVDEAEAFSHLEKPVTFAAFVNYLTRMIIEENDILTDKPPVKKNAVQLSTYHGSKGMEYEYVYMPYLIDKKINIKSPIIPLSKEDDITKDDYSGEDISKDLKDKIAACDKIKTIYVALTRAKHTLRLSYVKTTDDKKDVNPLKFIDTDEVRALINPQEFEPANSLEKYEDDVIKSLYGCDRDYEEEFSQYIDDILKDKIFSVSAINKYLGCSKEYFYHYVLGLRAQSDNPDSASVGSAVHAAYEYMVNEAKAKGKYPPKHEFLRKFTDTLKSLPTSSPMQLRHLLNEWANILQKETKEGNTCYSKLTATPVNELHKAEYEIKFKIAGCEFTGFIDRIDRKDGKYIIYDYKTGEPFEEVTQEDIDNKRTKKRVAHSVKEEHEDYYNQMAVYKHFLREELKCGYDDIITEFIFPRDVDKPCRLEISEHDCLEVIAKFEKAIKDIKAHKFVAKTNKKECTTFCPYKKSFCGLNVI